jgi:hypothetical protein
MSTTKELCGMNPSVATARYWFHARSLCNWYALYGGHVCAHSRPEVYAKVSYMECPDLLLCAPCRHPDPQPSRSKPGVIQPLEPSSRVPGSSIYAPPTCLPTARASADHGRHLFVRVLVYRMVRLLSLQVESGSRNGHFNPAPWMVQTACMPGFWCE